MSREKATVKIHSRRGAHGAFHCGRIAWQNLEIFRCVIPVITALSTSDTPSTFTYRPEGKTTTITREDRCKEISVSSGDVLQVELSVAESEAFQKTRGSDRIGASMRGLKRLKAV